MKSRLNRREFLMTTTLAAAGLGTAKQIHAASFKTKLHKAMIVDKLTEQDLSPLKDAGFEGVETTQIVDPDEAAAGRKVADKLGCAFIRSFVDGRSSIATIPPRWPRRSLRPRRRCGRPRLWRDAILVVPCRIDGMPMPQPWEFEIEFDDKSGHVIKVVAGDNAPFKAYIDAHNIAIDRSREAVRKLIPLAAELRVVIALENVWNNLWVKPAIYRHFVASFQSEWVRSYFDVGNHVKYEAPENWIHALGPMLAKKFTSRISS